MASWAKDDSRYSDTLRGQRAAAAGGIVGALASLSCCVLPLVLFTIGVSGSWISNLVQLAPYQPYFIAITIACLACGYWLVYRSARSSCRVGGRVSDRLVKSALILATVLVVAALSFNLVAPILNS